MTTFYTKPENLLLKNLKTTESGRQDDDEQSFVCQKGEEIAVEDSNNKTELNENLDKKHSLENERENLATTFEIVKDSKKAEAKKNTKSLRDEVPEDFKLDNESDLMEFTLPALKKWALKLGYNLPKRATKEETVGSLMATFNPPESCQDEENLRLVTLKQSVSV